MTERIKEKLAWWIVTKLPKRICLYAFCFVHGTLRTAPESDVEYSRAYKAFTKEWELP